jgi:integrase
MPRFGPDFKGASMRKVRQQKAAAGPKLFCPDEIRKLLQAADPIMGAMVIVGINGGMGNTDVARLPFSAVDFESDWIDFPRPKTGVARRFPLWPETSLAMRAAIEQRPEPSSDDLAGLVFLTRWGNSWVPDGRRGNQVSPKFRKLLRTCGIDHGGFYWLRHTFQTIADDAGDPIATAHVMGHADGTIGGVYRERISDERLRKVTDHVRTWLFPKAKAKPKGTAKAKRGPVGKKQPALRVVG